MADDFSNVRPPMCRIAGVSEAVLRQAAAQSAARIAAIVQCAGCGEGVVPAHGVCRRKRGHERPADCKAEPPSDGLEWLLGPVEPDVSGVGGNEK